MNVVLWVIAGLLAAVFLAAGWVHVSWSKAKLKAKGFGWTEHASSWFIKLLGALEILAAIGLILPALLHIAPVLVPLAALGLVLVMIGAAVVHAREKAVQGIINSVVLLVLAVVVVWGRLGPYPFTS
jgi:hypothetical protein